MTPPKNSSRFESTEEYYAKYRPRYGTEAIQYLTNSFKLDESDRVLDLGCGTGQIAIPLAEHVGEVVGMDPNGEMLRRARQQSTATGRDNIEWVVGSDADLSDDLGMFRLITMGRSFHWMDQEATLRQLYRIAESSGGVAILNDAEWLTRGTKDWQATAYSVVDAYLDDLPARTGPIDYSEEDPWDELLEEFGFTDVEVRTIEFERKWNDDGIAGYVFSLSFCSPQKFGDEKDAFENDLRARMNDLPSEMFTQDVKVTVISGRK